MLRRGDRVPCFTDWLVEEHRDARTQSGEDRLIRWVRPDPARSSGITSDDASMLMIEWRGGDADHLAVVG
jgi:hypothetical protein